MKLRLHLLSSAALLITSMASAQTYYSSADAYVSSANPAVNFGALGTMTAGPVGNTALVQVDLSRLIASGATAATVQQATMTVFVNKVLVGGALDVSLASSSWTESGVTFNTTPLAGTPFASNVAVPGS